MEVGLGYVSNVNTSLIVSSPAYTRNTDGNQLTANRLHVIGQQNKFHLIRNQPFFGTFNLGYGSSL